MKQPFIPPTATSWFEIPARNYERAIGFYEVVLHTQLIREKWEGEGEFALFPTAENGVPGCISQSTLLTPGASTIVFLVVEDLDEALVRTRESGGAVERGPDTLPKGMGRTAQIRDSEGNLVGLHQMPPITAR
jgi:hypothetical protein